MYNIDANMGFMEIHSIPFIKKRFLNEMRRVFFNYYLITISNKSDLTIR